MIFFYKILIIFILSEKKYIFNYLNIEFQLLLLYLRKNSLHIIFSVMS